MPPSEQAVRPVNARYRLGLPAWGYSGWDGHYFESDDRLRQYSGVFGTVEGNTTFYATPSTATTEDWARQLEGRDFRFCFKLPRAITHERGTRKDLARFLTALAPVEAFLGPFLLQLPASAGPDAVDRVRRIISALPTGPGVSLEVRHPDFFDTPERFDEYFAATGCYRTIMDARPVHLHASDHPEVLAARHEKPDLPVHARSCNNGALVRLVLHPDEQFNAPYYDAWTTQTASWLGEGQDVLMMIHCPNNFHCPKQAETFHGKLRTLEPRVPELPPWPQSQASLF